MSAAFSIGLSGIQVSQRALDLTGNNIANANTKGYHRQIAELANRTVGLTIGDGVRVKSILRQSSSVLESAATQNTVESQDVSTRLDNLRQIETFLNPGDGSAYDLLLKFFNELGQAASQPDDLARRRVVLAIAVSLAGQINESASQLSRMSQSQDGVIQDLVAKVNRISSQIADLNGAIQRNTIQEIDTSDLRDQRDQLINDLAQTVDIRTIDQDFGQKTVLVANGAVIIGNQSIQLQATTDAANNAIVTVSGTQTPLTVSGGQLGGALNIRNQVLPEQRNRLDALTQELVRGIDSLHATGIGLSGPSTLVSGQRAVSNVNTPLASAGLAFPPQAGTLFISVTDQATGQRTLNAVTIDPATQSLTGLAAAVGGVPNIQAVADTQTRTLRIIAAQGFSFDFAGRLPTAPSTTAITGTTTAQIGGRYTGSVNDTYTFTVVGSGTVGVTPGLAVQVTDSALNVLGTFNIGQGYEPGSSLPAINGVSARLATGTANVGDSFTVQTIAQPDTANILTALGLNTFFTGDNSSNVAVRADLLTSPEQLAAGRTGQPGDGSNLQRLAALQDTRVLSGGTQTFREFQANTISNIAIQVQDLSDRQTAQQVLGQRLDAEIQGISGVDTNEELVRMLQFQRSFQMSARFISTVNTALDDLINIV